MHDRENEFGVLICAYPAEVGEFLPVSVKKRAVTGTALKFVDSYSVMHDHVSATYEVVLITKISGAGQSP